MKNKPNTYIMPGFEIGKNAARFLAKNIIAASDLCALISVTLPQLSRLQAKGVVFRHSQGKYYLAESVANYFAYKAAPIAPSYVEALEMAKVGGMADPVACAREWSSWLIDYSDDIETVRRTQRLSRVADQIDHFQCELRWIRIASRRGDDPKHFNLAAEETFQLMRRMRLNDSKHASFTKHCRAWDVAWNPKREKCNEADRKAMRSALTIAETAAKAVAAEEAQALSRGR